MSLVTNSVLTEKALNTLTLFVWTPNYCLSMGSPRVINEAKSRRHKKGKHGR
ncbi:hypothetical protein LCGC14_1220800 [marine sediment metagenome]|uniref:Uncharacterized protein n=1 Tax=marine sediment metagenome TaxID=412755 RepID=A0A0F9LYH9_9ZZZZ